MAQPSIASFTASSTSIKEGESVTLRWQVSDAQTVRISPAGVEVPASDGQFIVVPPHGHTFYVLTAVGDGGEVRPGPMVNVYSEASSYFDRAKDFANDEYNKGKQALSDAEDWAKKEAQAAEDWARKKAAQAEQAATDAWNAAKADVNQAAAAAQAAGQKAQQTAAAAAAAVRAEVNNLEGAAKNLFANLSRNPPAITDNIGGGVAPGGAGAGPDGKPKPPEPGKPVIVAFDANAIDHAVKQAPHSLQVKEGDAVSIYWRVKDCKKVTLLPGYLVFKPKEDQVKLFDSHLIIRPKSNSDYMLLAEGEKGITRAMTHISVNDHDGVVSPHTWLLWAERTADVMDPFDWGKQTALGLMPRPYTLDAAYDNKDEPKGDDNKPAGPDIVPVPEPSNTSTDASKEKHLPPGGKKYSFKFSHAFHTGKGKAELKVPYGKLTEWGLELTITAELAKEGDLWEKTTEYDVAEHFGTEIGTKITLSESGQVKLDAGAKAHIGKEKISVEFSATVGFPKMRGFWKQLELTGAVEPVLFATGEKEKSEEEKFKDEVHDKKEDDAAFKCLGATMISVQIAQKIETEIERVGKVTFSPSGKFYVWFMPAYDDIFKTVCNFSEEVGTFELGFFWPVIDMIKETCLAMIMLEEFKEIDKKLREANEHFAMGFKEGVKSGTAAQIAIDDEVLKNEYEGGARYGAKVFEASFDKAKQTDKAKKSGASEDALRNEFRKQLAASQSLTKAVARAKGNHVGIARQNVWSDYFDKWMTRNGAMTATIYENWFIKGRPGFTFDPRYPAKGFGGALLISKKTGKTGDLPLWDKYMMIPESQRPEIVFQD